MSSSTCTQKGCYCFLRAQRRPDRAVQRSDQACGTSIKSMMCVRVLESGFHFNIPSQQSEKGITTNHASTERPPGPLHCSGKPPNRPPKNSTEQNSSRRPPRRTKSDARWFGNPTQTADFFHSEKEVTLGCSTRFLQKDAANRLNP